MIVEVNENRKSEWDAVAEKCYYPFPTYYYGWVKAMEASYTDTKAVHFAIEEDSKLKAVAPFVINSNDSVLSSSFMLGPGFISGNVNPGDLLKHIIKYSVINKLVKIILQIPPGYYYHEILFGYGFRLTRKVTFFQLALNDHHDFVCYVNSLGNKGKKSDIKASLKKGMVIESGPFDEILYDRFEKSYLELGGRKEAKLPPKQFYFHLSSELTVEGKYWIAVVDGADAGAALTFETGDRIWIMWLQGGDAFKSYKVSTFLYAEIINYAIAKKIRIVDFGTSSIDSPLGDFKQRLGAKPFFHDIYEYDLGYATAFKKFYRDVVRIFKKRNGF